MVSIFARTRCGPVKCSAASALGAGPYGELVAARNSAAISLCATSGRGPLGPIQREQTGDPRVLHVVLLLGWPGPQGRPTARDH
jgi:hypothetical protein